MKMRQTEVNDLAKLLSNKYGIEVKITIRQEPTGPIMLLEPEGIYQNEGFRIEIKIGWRNITFEFLPGKFAKELVILMGSTSLERKSIFQKIAQEIISKKGDFVLTVNGSKSDLNKLSEWPRHWYSLSILMKVRSVEVDIRNTKLFKEIIYPWIDRFYSAIVTLLPIEEDVNVDSDVIGMPEGSLTKITVNKYERSKHNRNVCITFHGYTCKVCDMNLTTLYGDLASDYIHVHHVRPVSELGENYVINPISDLIPVCPNCHSMIHRRNPAFSVSELRTIINEVLKDNQAK